MLNDRSEYLKIILFAPYPSFVIGPDVLDGKYLKLSICMGKFYRFLIVLFLAAITNGHGQQTSSFRWGINGGSVDQGPLALTERVREMASDPNGNTYITSCVYRNNISVAGANLPDGHDYQFTDILLTSLNCEGAHRWSKIIGGIPGDEAPFVKVSPQGHVYLAGYVTKTNSHPIDFSTDTTLAAPGFQTLFIVQYDTLGNMKWLRMLQSDTVTPWSFSRTQFMDMDIDDQGNVYAMCKFPPGSALSGSTLTTPPGQANQDMCMLKYSAQGQLLSVTKMDMRFNNSGANGIYLRRHPTTGNFYITGVLVPYAPYNDTLYLGNNYINTTNYLACYSPSGQLLWHKQNSYTSGLNNTMLQQSVQIDAQGDLYLAGQGAHGDAFNGHAFNNPLGNTIADVVSFVMKMTPSGSVIWTSTGYSYPYSMTMKMSVANKVAVGGSYAGLFIWNNDTLKNAMGSGQDGWFAILDKTTGTLLHLDSVPGPSVYDGVTAVHYHGPDLYIGGYFQTSLKVGPHVVNSNGGSSDFFVAKYGYPCNCTPPNASFTYQNNGNDIVQFTHTSTGPVDGVRWYFGDGQSSVQPNPTHQYIGSGDYNVCLVAYNSCGSDSVCQTVNTTVGLESLSVRFPDLLVYPNPFSGNLFVDHAVPGMVLSFYNVIGQQVARYTLREGKNSIDTGALPKGIYMIRLYDLKGNTVTKQIVKL